LTFWGEERPEAVSLSRLRESDERRALRRRGVKISGEAVLCNGRGVTREKSQFQTGYIPRRRKLRFARFDASVKSSPAPLLLLSPQSRRLCGGPQLIT